MHRFILAAGLLGFALTGANLTQADTLKIFVSEQGGAQQDGLPQRGQSTALVRQTHGEPTSVQSAPGTPPISVWRYGQFTVYFERDSVIHAVRHHQPGD